MPIHIMCQSFDESKLTNLFVTQINRFVELIVVVSRWFVTSGRICERIVVRQRGKWLFSTFCRSYPLIGIIIPRLTRRHFRGHRFVRRCLGVALIYQSLLKIQNNRTKRLCRHCLTCLLCKKCQRVDGTCIQCATRARSHTKRCRHCIHRGSYARAGRG